MPTLGDYLGRNGYQTALVRKAHFQPTKSTSEYSALESYQDERCGELYDLSEDFHELHNLWYDPDQTDLCSELLARYVRAELEREGKSMPRISGA